MLDLVKQDEVQGFEMRYSLFCTSNCSFRLFKKAGGVGFAPLHHDFVKSETLN